MPKPLVDVDTRPSSAFCLTDEPIAAKMIAVDERNGFVKHLQHA